MLSVLIVGGPCDGAEIPIESPGNRVHIAVHDNPGGMWWLDGPVGPSCREVVLNVHLTRDGYRAYWPEHLR